MNRNLPIYKCEIDESLNDDTGIFAISFVDFPAVEVDFVALSKQKKETKLHLNQDKQILTGVVLIPDQMIYRYNQATQEEYYITHSAESIEKISHKMMRNSIVLHNTTHQHEDQLAGNYLTEMWIIQDPSNNKSNTLGFKDLPKGTLMCSYKITDNDYWNNEVKTGNVKGFSLEGYFYQEKLSKTNKNQLSIDKRFRNNKRKNTNKMNKNKNKNTNLLSKIGRFFLDIEDVEIADATDSGENFRIFTLADGSEVYVAEDGYCTINDEQAPAGEHLLSDDSIIVIDADGMLVETTDEPTIEEPATPEVELESDEAFTVDINGTSYEVDEAVATYVGDLLAKIADLEGTVADDAIELKKLRKVTPSARPANVKQNTQKVSYQKMTRDEKLAFQLSQFQNK